MVEQVAVASAACLDRFGESAADGGGIGGDPPQRDPEPTVRDGGLGTDDGEEVGTRIHAAITRSTMEEQALKS